LYPIRYKKSILSYTIINGALEETSYCPVPNIIEKVPANNGYQPRFMAKMMLKDLGLGEAAAEDVSASLPLGSKAMELYQLFVKEGHGEMDFSGIIKIIG